MSRRRVAAALDELASIRAVGPRPSRRSHGDVWHAVPPASVIESLRRRRTRPVKVTTSGRDRQALMRAVVPEPLQLGDELRHLPGRATTRARLAELVAAARHEHLSMNPESTFDAEALRSAAPMDRVLLERGVRTRVLGVQAANADPLASHGLPPIGSRLDYRVAPTVPVKLFIIDRSVALFPVAPDDVERGYLEVRQTPIVSALVALFQQHWASAEDPQECPVPQITISPRERALIVLLAQGHTDATAARELRISARSVSNILRTLMDRLGVDNRFQLGLALGSAHAVAPPTNPVRPEEEER